MSYNNLIDAAAALELVLDLHANTNCPTATVIKHTNPCGAACGSTIEEAFVRAWEGDPVAAFGGIVALSENVSASLAKVITKGEKFLEVVVAPTFSKVATQTLTSRWKSIRLLAVGRKPRPDTWQTFRSVAGGFLMQNSQPITASIGDWSRMAGPKPTKKVLSDAAFAWITCAHLRSNAISIVSDGSLIGAGMGQVDRLSAARLATQRASEALRTAPKPVVGSDAFFPFSDGPQLLIDAGIKCIVQPGGSIRDQETVDVCEEAGVTLLHTGIRCFRH